MNIHITIRKKCLPSIWLNFSQIWNSLFVYQSYITLCFCWETYHQKVVKVLFGDVFHNKNMILHRLTNKEWVLNWEVYSQKDGRNYFNFWNVIYSLSLTIVDGVLLPKSSEHTVWWCSSQQKHNFHRLTDREWVSNWEECSQKDRWHYFLLLQTI